MTAGRILSATGRGVFPLLTLLATIAPAATMWHTATPIDELRSRHSLLLLCRDRGGEVVAALEPYLEALDEVYGADGLKIAIKLQGDGPGSRLELWGPDPVPLLAQEDQALDLWAVYRTCERQLRGRRPGTFHEHVADVLADLVDDGAAAWGHTDGRGRPLAELLTAGDAYLLLPPGCNECLLNRFEAAVLELQERAPSLPVLCFDPEAATALTALGWQGDKHVLPLSARARLLSLRQAGVYTPVVVSRTDAGDLFVRSLREEVDAWVGR